MIEIERATDAAFINYVANEPSVHPHLLAGGQAIDYTPVVNDANNVVLVGSHGGMVFHKCMPGIFEVHTQALPEGRGRWTLEMAHSCLMWMFTRTDAIEIFTRVPHGNEPARTLTLNVGGVLEQHVSIPIHGDDVTFGVYRLRIEDWIKTSPYLEAMGAAFHARLHAEYDRLGMKVAKHDPDPWHDRNAGMAYLMITGGQIAKGVGYYNRHAVMAMAPPISLISMDPVVVNIQDAYLKVRPDGGFDVMEARG